MDTLGETKAKELSHRSPREADGERSSTTQEAERWEQPVGAMCTVQGARSRCRLIEAAWSAAHQCRAWGVGGVGPWLGKNKSKSKEAGKRPMSDGGLAIEIHPEQEESDQEQGEGGGNRKGVVLAKSRRYRHGVEARIAQIVQSVSWDGCTRPPHPHLLTDHGECSQLTPLSAKTSQWTGPFKLWPWIWKRIRAFRSAGTYTFCGKKIENDHERKKQGCRITRMPAGLDESAIATSLRLLPPSQLAQRWNQSTRTSRYLSYKTKSILTGLFAIFGLNADNSLHFLPLERICSGCCPLHSTS
ncbi:hypothetical protein B0H13DRAFT_2267647 [Mycena leptocephala]|nr:hypothetical protein B0H13DRAFT_2267647 [Mycena leptocephala]